ncbi:MAG: hypothetical protein R2854_18230 [Caldilineaceae bacterium]
MSYLHVYRATQVHVEELMALDAAAFIPQPAPQASTSGATEVDLPALIAFYTDAGHMTRRAAAVARPLRDTRLWLAQEAGTVVAAALTNAETANLAMIGGVYTPPAQRRRSQPGCVQRPLRGPAGRAKAARPLLGHAGRRRSLSQTRLPRRGGVAFHLVGEGQQD